MPLSWLSCTTFALITLSVDVALTSMPAAVALPDVTTFCADSLCSMTLPDEPWSEIPWFPEPETELPETVEPVVALSLMPTEADAVTVDDATVMPELEDSTRMP